MIKKLVERVQKLFARKPRLRKEPKRLSAQEHAIDPALVPRNAQRVCETLQKGGHQAFIVGGAVRDLLLGVAPKDFDVATDATPEQVKSHFRRAIVIGRRFRLVHVMFGAETIEVSTFRALDNPDRQTDAHGRVLADNLYGPQHEDAARRDFTINALYYDPVARTVLDYHDGVRDIRRRRLRVIGDPASRYREDPVRMLRAVRFAAKLGFEIDEATRAPIRALADLIGNVPPARLFDEMLKLLTSGHAVACITRLRAEGLHHGLLPLLDVILEQPQGERFVMLALSRTDERARAGKPVAPGYLFATLLWHEVLKRWKEREARGEHRIPALDAAIDDVLELQTEKLAIQRRYTSDMREVWMLQPRFERRGGRAAFKLLEHARLRGAYDFLLLRCAADEAPAELGQWWSDFLHGDAEARERLVAALTRVEAAPGTRRRRRRRATGSGRQRGRAVKRRAYLGLGANLGEPEQTLHAALEALKSIERSELVGVSPFYRSAPVDCDGPDFVNAAASLDTELEPYALLLHLQDIELMLGRKRRGGGERNVSRKADLDLLLLGELILRSTPLTLPHPRLHLRAFVLRPLLDLDPDLQAPALGRLDRFLESVADQRLARLDAPAD